MHLVRRRRPGRGRLRRGDDPAGLDAALEPFALVRLCRESPSVGRRVYNWIASIAPARRVCTDEVCGIHPPAGRPSGETAGLGPAREGPPDEHRPDPRPPRPPRAAPPLPPRARLAGRAQGRQRARVLLRDGPRPGLLPPPPRRRGLPPSTTRNASASPAPSGEACSRTSPRGSATRCPCRDLGGIDEIDATGFDVDPPSEDTGPGCGPTALIRRAGPGRPASPAGIESSLRGLAPPRRSAVAVGDSSRRPASRPILTFLVEIGTIQISTRTGSRR